jgi:hypothetical protein
VCRYAEWKDSYLFIKYISINLEGNLFSTENQISMEMQQTSDAPFLSEIPLNSQENSGAEFWDYFVYRSQVSSVSIVSDYRLDDRAIGVRSPAGTKDFFL